MGLVGTHLGATNKRLIKLKFNACFVLKIVQLVHNIVAEEKLFMNAIQLHRSLWYKWELPPNEYIIKDVRGLL